MKKVISFLFLIMLCSVNASAFAHAKTIQCENLSDGNFSEDSLTIDTVTKTATYFDNDTYHSLPCAVLKSVSLTVCADRLFTVKIKHSGEAIAYEGNSSTPNAIPFFCSL